MVNTIEQIEGLSKRLDKARELLANDKVHPVIGMDSHYVVEASDGKGFYLVNGVCTCPDAGQRTELHNGWCKHNLAVELYKEANTDEVTEDKPQVNEVDLGGLYPPDES